MDGVTKLIYYDIFIIKKLRFFRKANIIFNRRRRVKKNPLILRRSNYCTGCIKGIEERNISEKLEKEGSGNSGY